MSVPFIDLKTQYAKIQDKVNQNIQNVLAHGKYIMGPEVAQLEQKLANFCGAKHAISCSSGTDALSLALMAYDVGKGDAIFVPSFTFFASAEVVALTGATPVFVDSDSSTFNMCPQRLAEQIDEINQQGKLRIKGIMPVNLFGLAPDFDAIDALAKKHDLFVIEDTAQGFGGTYHGKVSGSLGDISATSFFPAKPLGCYGDGGAVFTSNDTLAAKMRSLRVHGQGEDKYDNVRIGLNARMDTLQAAIMLPKLDIFAQEIALRQQVASAYSEALNGLVDTPFIPEGYQSVWAQYSVLSDDRKSIQEALQQAKIPSVVYYRIPCHLAKAFAYLGYKEGDLPNCEQAAKRIFSLPMHPYVEKSLAKKIANVIENAIN